VQNLKNDWKISSLLFSQGKLRHTEPRKPLVISFLMPVYSAWNSHTPRTTTRTDCSPKNPSTSNKLEKTKNLPGHVDRMGDLVLFHGLKDGIVDILPCRSLDICLSNYCKQFVPFSRWNSRKKIWECVFLKKTYTHRPPTMLNTSQWCRRSIKYAWKPSRTLRVHPVLKKHRNCLIWAKPMYQNSTCTKSWFIYFTD
jgi:hypothetical protein